MKYIKTYENINQQFVIYKPSENIIKKGTEYLMIYEIVNKYKDKDNFNVELLDVVRHYMYEIKKNKLIINNSRPLTISLDNFYKNVLFSSNNINDCIKNISIILDIDKYNL